MSKQPKEKNKSKKQSAGSLHTKKQERVLSYVVFAIAFLLYANTLGHDYALDDDVVFVKNRDVQAGFKGIGSILIHSFIYGFTGHNDQSYRPVVSIVFAIEKQLFGSNPHIGHFINVILFAFACVLLFKLMNKLLLSITMPSFSIAGLQVTVPFSVALLFAVHPIHTEAVANIKGRDDILNFIFLELSLIYILKYIDEGIKKYFLLSATFFFLSLLCKEMAVTFLATIPLTVFFFRNVDVKKIAGSLAGFVGVFVLYMIIRSSVLETVTFADKMTVMNNALVAAGSSSDRLATALFILGKYVLLLFFPHPLSWDYSFNQIPIVSFTDVKTIITLCVLAALAGYALLTLKQRNIFSYCILFFFITLSVVSNVFILIGSTLGERFLFTPSLAFCLAVPFFLKRFDKTVFNGVLASIVLLFAVKTIARNAEWKNNESLFAAGVEASPNSSRAQSSLGSAYRERAEKESDLIKRGPLYAKAIEQYKLAVKILPENVEALYNMGVCYYTIGDRENALKVYGQTLHVSPEYTNAANNLGVIYFERKDYANARKYFEQAVKYSPSNADALGNLGAICHNTGDYKNAITYYEKALTLSPGNQNIINNMQSAKSSLSATQQKTPLAK